MYVIRGKVENSELSGANKGFFEEAVDVLAVGCFGTENVNDASLRAMFSDCNLERRSRKFSFSVVAC